MATHVTYATGNLNPVGLVYGVEWRYLGGTQAIDSIAVAGVPIVPTGGKRSFNFSSSGLAVNVGVGIAWSEQWHSELVALYGINHLSSSSPGDLATPSAISSTPGSGKSQTTGIRLGLYHTSDTNWQWGFIGEWTQSHGRLHVSYTDVTNELNVRYGGIGARLSVGCRF
ncbi:MAG: hypothetical protein AAB263_15475 [Planctomycetota bacterium]|mgnify:FL=1